MRTSRRLCGRAEILLLLVGRALPLSRRLLELRLKRSLKLRLPGLFGRSMQKTEQATITGRDTASRDCDSERELTSTRATVSSRYTSHSDNAGMEIYAGCRREVYLHDNNISYTH